MKKTLICERCGVVSTGKMCCYNPFNYEKLIPKKKTILCLKCRAEWHRIFARINGCNTLIRKRPETEEAWKEFMYRNKVKVQFT